ncbi:MAG: hypothetical protein JRJ59_02750 [Deltaproteobacteria bacterium]|nr:hypothetical protein [Deltaproteobacteria bacterium]
MVKEGIWAEEKKGSLGVAGTSKTIVFKNLWATREISDGQVVLQLLDDKGRPTHITERISHEELARRCVFRPVKAEVWAALKKKVMAARPGQTEPASRPQPEPAAPKTEAQTAPAKPVAPKAAAKPQPVGDGVGNWWEAKR